MRNIVLSFNPMSLSLYAEGTIIYDAEKSILVRSWEDLMGLPTKQVLELNRLLDPSDTVKSYHTKREGAKKVMDMLDMAWDRASQDGTLLPVGTKDATPSPDATATPEEDDMAKKAKAKSKAAPKAAEPKTKKTAEVNDVGLRVGSKMELAYKQIKRKQSTLDEIGEAAGTSAKNANQLLTDLRRKGIKVEAKGEGKFGLA